LRHTRCIVISGYNLLLKHDWKQLQETATFFLCYSIMHLWDMWYAKSFALIWSLLSQLHFQCTECFLSIEWNCYLNQTSNKFRIKFEELILMSEMSVAQDRFVCAVLCIVWKRSPAKNGYILFPASHVSMDHFYTTVCFVLVCVSQNRSRIILYRKTHAMQDVFLLVCMNYSILIC
jgi:hypothetical protein